MEAVRHTPGLQETIKEAYARGAFIAGTSAGAAVMSQIMITGDQKKYSEYTSTFYHLEKDNIVTSDGLGLIKDIIVDQHFIKRARNNRLLTAIMEFPDKIGIGIDESTAVLIKEKQAKVVGESQVLVYRNKADSVLVRNGKLGARDIRLQIYLPGDEFSLSKR
jgi:cyanophycinase